MLWATADQYEEHWGWGSLNPEVHEINKSLFIGIRYGATKHSENQA